MSDEFGTWIDHDGNGCPVKGLVVECRWLRPDGNEAANADDGRGIGVAIGSPCWFWDTDENGQPRSHAREFSPIIRYRVKKPRGLTILENLISEIPEEVAG